MMKSVAILFVVAVTALKSVVNACPQVIQKLAGSCTSDYQLSCTPNNMTFGTWYVQYAQTNFQCARIDISPSTDDTNVPGSSQQYYVFFPNQSASQVENFDWLYVDDSSYFNKISSDGDYQTYLMIIELDDQGMMLATCVTGGTGRNGLMILTRNPTDNETANDYYAIAQQAGLNVQSLKYIPNTDCSPDFFNV